MAPERLTDARAAVQWLRATVPGTLRTDSRQVRPGDAFIAWPGHAVDGRGFVAQALHSGAAACLVEAEGVGRYAFDDARIKALPALKAATGVIADAWFGQPSRRLQLLATTGTNGKTSTAWWLAQALTRLGRRCGVIGTLGIGEPPQAAPAPGGEPPPAAGDARAAIESTGLTTPDPVTLHAALRRFADAGFGACALEASSIGLVEERLAGTSIAVALFTNLTRDHLDYHGSMQAYGDAKRRLFAWPGLRAAVLNVDDDFGAELAAQLALPDLWTVSVDGAARLVARELRYEDGGLAFDVVEGAQRVPLRSALIGSFNASNLLVVIGGLRALGVPLVDAVACVPALTPVPGRLQRVAGSDLEVVVDYAHTPDALEKALQALRPLAVARAGRLWCVFGCGGNRDASKRPLMGAIAARLADRVVVTSDNPRDEAPGFILSQILAGMVGCGRVDVIEDRREAIVHALRSAAAGDLILLAGKGHEDYQEVAGRRLPFSDLDEARRALAARAQAGT
jgi:UDP-N-acetylmuramoyl-L-alanyl-D-glutamate--2,6-diaminopimelate ligase